MTEKSHEEELGLQLVELKEEERTRCEVWSRVMGYFRPTCAYNPGKYQEFCDRKTFKEPDLSS